MDRRIFIGGAWPYANGSLHLGHAAALIGADVLARYFRLNGDKVLFVSGSDCHGTPIALEADRLGINPIDIADKYHAEFVYTLVDQLNFSYDIYSKTTSSNHHKVVQDIFKSLYEKGYLYTKKEELPYCEQCSRFLPDRYIEGECPNCHYANARGDQCDNCGNLINAKQLIDIYCKICNSVPVWKESEHFFLKLSLFQNTLTEWLSQCSGEWRANAKKFTTNFLQQGLHDRAITRDTQWGVPIPIKGYENKRIYVWFEAVCGYLSASKEWASNIGVIDKWKQFWENDTAVHYYVHGKDNIPFHTIIWPAILLGVGQLHLPDKIISSEYLSLEGKQFSKSRQWAIWLPDYLKHFDADPLRFYLIINGPETSDSVFTWQDIATKNNSELIGNFGNFIYRTLSLIKNNFPDGIQFPDVIDTPGAFFLDIAKNAFSSVGLAIEKGRFREALRNIFVIVEHGNRYINNCAPWASVKTDKSKAEHDLAIAGHVIRCLSILINPFLPKSSKQLCDQVGLDFTTLTWKYPEHGFLLSKNAKPLYKRIDQKDIEAYTLEFNGV